MNNIVDKLTNLTSDVSTIQGKLNKILEFVQTAPDIAKLPKDVEELKTVVADLGSKMNTDDKEVKINSEKQAQQTLKLEGMDERIKSLEGNISDVSVKANTKFASSIESIQSDMQKLNFVIANISKVLEDIATSQEKLDKWRLEIDDQVNHLKQQDDAKNLKISESSHTVFKKVLKSNSTLM